MLIIQILLIAFALFALYRTVGRFRSGDLPLVQLVLWTALWGGVVLVSVLPETLSRLADSLGVGRGVDVVIYFSIVTLFYAVFRLFVRIEKMERNITQLVRKISVSEINEKDGEEAHHE